MNDKEKTSRPAADRKPRRKMLREEVVEIDQQILRLLLKRHNLLEKMRHKGKLDSSEEKFLREAWQNDVARVSRDADLSGRFFSLLQNIRFLPRPEPTAEGEITPGFRRRDAFNLAPPREKVNFSMTAPLDSRATRIWVYLAACAGRKLRLLNSPQNDPIVDFIKALEQMGAAIPRDENGVDGAITVRAGFTLGCPDKILYAGGSEFNFYMLLAHYLGRHSLVKFTGETPLKLADYSNIRRALPSLGARLIHVVPKSTGLPARVESSGILPPSFAFAADLPADFAIALLLAAPFYDQPFAVDLAPHPQKEEIKNFVLPFLSACGITFALGGDCVNIEPSAPAIPETPDIAADPRIAAFLLALAEPLGGSVRLRGRWPDWQKSATLEQSICRLNLPWNLSGKELAANCQTPIAALDAVNAGLDNLPLWTALCACACLNGGQAALPVQAAALPEVADFLRAAGLMLDESGKIHKIEGETDPQPWNAPSAEWAMALAIAACARGKRAGFQLGNPGIVADLWPYFWVCYNSLPEPSLKKPQPETPRRRRIHTDAEAVLPEMKDEDW